VSVAQSRLLVVDGIEAKWGFAESDKYDRKIFVVPAIRLK